MNHENEPKRPRSVRAPSVAHPLRWPASRTASSVRAVAGRATLGNEDEDIMSTPQPAPAASTPTLLSPRREAPLAPRLRATPTPGPLIEEFVLLAPRRENPQAAEIEARSLALAERLGLVTPANQARFEAFNSLGRHVYPHASVERGVLCAMWCNWLFFFDDMHDEEPRSRDDQSHVRRMVDHALALLSGARRPTGTPAPLDALLLEFRREAMAIAGAAWLDRLWCVTADHMSLGVLPALRNWGTSRTPPLREYLSQREHDSGVMTALDLIEPANAIRLAPEVRDHPIVLKARRAASRTVGFFNDIVSFPKEVLRHKNPNNLVHVLMREHDWSLEMAVREATELANAEARALERCVAEAGSSWPEGHPVQTYLRGLLEWQRGNIEWSLTSPRYEG
jgi:germacradienol/geosmin synthase